MKKVTFADAVLGLEIEEPVSRSVVVLSPHPDDDVLGCGGTLAKHLSSGCQVTVVYLTDGRMGDPSGRYTESDLAKLREEEAAAACHELGIQNLLFLRKRDRALRADADTVREVLTVLKEHAPERVYLPCFFDGFFHPDHLQANAILEKAIAERSNFLAYGYEIYTALVPNRIVDITRQADIKRMAIAHHKSQLKLRAISKILSLNEYRAAMLCPPSVAYAEAFLGATPRTYMQLFRSLFPM